MPTRPVFPPPDPRRVPAVITLRPEGGYLVVWSDGVETVVRDLAALVSTPTPSSDRWNKA